ncbi:MAG: CAP domain-containing protein [Blastocatellia bacterium]|nr:CAP domain-containing protein [Blastocatellia bacterium]
MSNTAHAGRSQLGEADLKEIRAQLLKLVNQERAMAHVPPLVLDDLANRVADAHALDMATNKFLSHCGRNGSKPYHRYSFAGGIHSLSENVSALDKVRTTNPADLAKDLTYMHATMHAEVPPDDGHRRNILAPHHTHVGFGIALHDDTLRLAEEYIGKYIEVVPFKQRSTPRDRFFLRGRLLDRKHILRSVEIFYEPFPRPIDLASLPPLSACGLPPTFVTLYPRLPDGEFYIDGRRGTIELGTAGWFALPVELFKDEPGIYTIVFWISKTPREKPFAATSICIKSEK